MANLEIHCPYCSDLVRVRPENLGNLLQCPSCPGKFRVPSDLAQTSAAQGPQAQGPRAHGPLTQGSLPQRPANPFSGAARPGSGGLGSGNQGVSNSNVRLSGTIRQPVHPQPAPMSRGYQTAAGYTAYAQQQNSANQNMVMIVIGVAIGVFLILFLALLLMLGAGGMRAMEFSPSVNGVSSDLITATDPALQQPGDATEEAEEALPAGIRRNENNELSIRWRARQGVVYDEEVEPLSKKSNDDSSDLGFRFPAGQSNRGGTTRLEAVGPQTPPPAPKVPEKREPHRYTANKSLDGF